MTSPIFSPLEIDRPDLLQRLDDEFGAASATNA
jgi:hypothetical protein